MSDDPTTICPFCKREHDTPELLELRSKLHSLAEQVTKAELEAAGLYQRLKEAETRLDALERMYQAAEQNVVIVREQRDNALGRLSSGLERIERLRDWIQERADNECPYGEMDFEACGHNRKHGICASHAAAKVLAQDTFVSDAPVVERQEHKDGTP